MNVASLELCKELYGLSGWKTDYYWVPSSVNVSPDVNNPSYEVRAWEEITSHMNWDRALQISLSVPAYDLGYLLRNLPKSIERGGRHYALHLQHDLSRTLWRITYGGNGKLRQNMSTGRAPEDAAAKLAIELFKQGRLKREES